MLPLDHSCYAKVFLTGCASREPVSASLGKTFFHTDYIPATDYLYLENVISLQRMEQGDWRKHRLNALIHSV